MRTALRLADSLAQVIYFELTPGETHLLPELANISVYPIKSLDGHTLSKVRVLKSGALQGDREFAILDKQGRFINGKRNPKVHSLHSWFDAKTRTVSFQVCQTNRVQFYVDNVPAIEGWLSNYFGFGVRFVQSMAGFPDDTDASGPTIISTATLEVVASWFPSVSIDEMRLRLRSNLEVGGVAPFWEDQLFAEPGYVVQFQVGDVLFEGTNPCQRCIVPARDSQSGEAYPQFQKIFTQNRQATLPSWAISPHFNHFFKLAVNTRIPESEGGKVLRVGDSVKIFGTAKKKPSDKLSR